eukprot:758577-Hanusia_phi.AAC.1
MSDLKGFGPTTMAEAEVVQSLVRLWQRAATPASSSASPSDASFISTPSQNPPPQNLSFQASFLSSCAGLTQAARMAKMKAAQEDLLRMLILACRERINSVCQAMRMSDEERSLYPELLSSEVSESALERLEDVEARLAMDMESMRPLITGMTEYEHLLRERSMLETSFTDSSRLLDRSSNSFNLRRSEERYKALVLKIIPEKRRELLEGIERWEIDQGKTFLTWGRRYLDNPEDVILECEEEEGGEAEQGRQVQGVRGNGKNKAQKVTKEAIVRIQHSREQPEAHGMTQHSKDSAPALESSLAEASPGRSRCITASIEEVAARRSKKQEYAASLMMERVEALETWASDAANDVERLTCGTSGTEAAARAVSAARGGEADSPRSRARDASTC